MREASVGHLGVLGYIVFMQSIVRRAIPFVATIWIVAAASCAVAPPSPTPTGGPPRIPHSLEGREGRCLLCHQEGVGGAPRVTAAHLGRTNDICTLCHIPAAGNAAHEAAPSGTAPTVASGAVATPASQAAAGKAGPGSIQDGQDAYDKFCNGCHPNGKAGVGPTLIGKTDANIRATVRQGKGGMPGFAAGQISDAQLADLTTYVMSLNTPSGGPPAAAPSGSPSSSPTAAPSGTAPTVASGAAATPASQAAAGKAGPGSIQDGQDAYDKFCNGCHPNGKAGVGPTLIGKTDATIKATVRQGKGGMPGFAAGQISDAQLADLAAYVTSLK